MESIMKQKVIVWKLMSYLFAIIFIILNYLLFDSQLE